MPSARSLYAEFHGEAPKAAYDRRVRWLDNPVSVGKARSIVYRSNKWNEGTHDYEHKIEGGVEVIIDASDKAFGNVDGIDGRRGTKICGLPHSAARIGTAVELVVTLHNGQNVRLTLDRGNGLRAGPDFVSFSRNGMHYYAILRDKPIVLRTKDMVVTAAGLDG